MTDHNELRKLAEAANEIDSVNWWDADNRDHLPSFSRDDRAYIAAASPDVFLGLLDERDQLRAEVDRQKAWAQQMALADVEHLREVLGIIAEFDPAVTHGWAECVREMARSALKAR